MDKLADINAINKKLKAELESRATHDDLCKAAKTWLSFTKGCNPVFMERGTSYEKPDAIGWLSESNGSILVECKTNAGDFRADAKKKCRIDPDSGMGRHRYFLLTPELFEKVKDEIPEGWGVCLFENWSGYGNVRQVNGMRSKVWEYSVYSELYCLRNRILEVQRFGT